ncbi:MAG: translocation/assembly module TamB domain-containing protein [Alphaproteobacteria bacterium]|nr:translocation/assembly module TamB domain-containing protein [Alphaproteobacteria bacterium]MBU0794428.1 translocation/assembly module TamB domain-containing protein [Alphaproteobacteria bacterium]MBU0874820.1 translocation/assembly module TamB domain-containing protein [Alphaproteobacteria bacterium]MBU1768345.1 translocation/assembly module TamB domain-containing protein [Alphaproteobacteria bacterium]
MAQDDVTQPGEAEGQAGPPRRRRSRLRSGISLTVILLVVALLAALWGGIRWLDSEGGHRFILQKIAQWQPDSGLRITVGSIEGRIFNDMTLRDVRFFDRKGQFASVDQADVSWYPMGWLSNRLDLDRLRIHSADLTRIPELRPSTSPDRAMLPNFDIRLADLRIDRFALGPAVLGEAHVIRAIGDADIRSGRAVVSLLATAPRTGDVVRLELDSRPDDRRFDIDAVVVGPQGGVIASALDADQPVALRVRGDGDWRRWQGRLTALTAGRLTANVALMAQEGRYRAQGPLALLGPLEPLTALGSSQAQLEADVRFENRLLSGTTSLSVPSARLSATGGVDFARNRFDELRLSAVIDRPGQVAAGLTGQSVQLRARLAGPFDAMELGYLITSAELRQGGIALRNLRLEGEGRLNGPRGRLPIRLTAQALSIGQRAVDERLRNLVVDSVILRNGNNVRLEPSAVRASGSRGQIEGQGDLAAGSYLANFRGGLDGLEISGLGRLDLDAVLRLARPANGQSSFAGTARAVMRRLDNGFLLGLGEGLPVVTSQIGLAPGGGIALRDLRLVAPALTLEGNGRIDNAGQLDLQGEGEHRAYGPLELALSGQPGRPRVDVTLARPLPAVGLANVRALLEPDERGYAVTVEGGSMFGAFKGSGSILLPSGGTATISVADLGVSGVTVTGDLVPVSGGLQGALSLTGPAEGQVMLGMVDGVQRIGFDVDLSGANFTGSPNITVNRGAIEGEALLRSGAVTIDANAQGRGVRVGGVRIGRFAGALKLVNGAGSATLSMNARTGRSFDLQARAAIAPGRIGVDLEGALDQSPVRLDRTAVLNKVADGWRLEPATLRIQGGALRLAGFVGESGTEVEARMQALPLLLLDLANSELGLGGTADGTVQFAAPADGAPTGRLNLRVKGLTRSGLALSSAPIDIGVNAELDSRRLAARAVVARGSTTVGRAQALVTPLGSGSLSERLLRSPLQAQFRYAGDADTLWRLTNVEIVSLGGDLRLSANAGGTLSNPRIEGTLSTRNGRVTSPVTGMALRDVRASGRFSGSQLTIPDLQGRAGSGEVSGTAVFDLSAERGIGMDIDLQADRAVLMDRDDVGATVTGPLRIRSSGNGGTISGDLQVVASRFTLGRASASAEIPHLRLVEINRSGDQVERTRAAAPWRLDIAARVPRGLTVEGLGMQSEWSADLTIGGLATAPAFSGTATLVRGSYDFAGRRFDLQEGRLTFTGTSPVNPRLDIRAVADVQDLSATITVTGTSLRPIIAFSSIPAMAQDELLSRLLFGTSIANLSAPEALQLASAVAAFQGGGGGLDPINAVRRATGLSRLRVLGADTTTGRQTSIAAGKNIGDNLYVELITDGQGYSATSIEYQITRWLALISTVSTIGRQSAAARISKDY